jgi:hypothetical protein
MTTIERRTNNEIRMQQSRDDLVAMIVRHVRTGCLIWARECFSAVERERLADELRQIAREVDGRMEH